MCAIFARLNDFARVLMLLKIRNRLKDIIFCVWLRLGMKLPLNLIPPYNSPREKIIINEVAF